MGTILFQITGVLIFVLVTLVSGKLIRRKPNLTFAQKPIRMVHFCFWFFLVLPAGICLIYPGFLHLDAMLGLKSLPENVFLTISGGILFLTGSYYGFSSTRLLALVGNGAMAFKFSQRTVVSGVYYKTRNPMALGYYMMLLGVGLITHSTYFFFSI